MDPFPAPVSRGTSQFDHRYLDANQGQAARVDLVGSPLSRVNFFSKKKYLYTNTLSELLKSNNERHSAVHTLLCMQWAASLLTGLPKVDTAD